MDEFTVSHGPNIVNYETVDFRGKKNQCRQYLKFYITKLRKFSMISYNYFLFVLISCPFLKNDKGSLHKRENGSGMEQS